VPTDLSPFTFCPIEARFIDDVEGACSYYAHKMARSHEITRYDRKVAIIFEGGATHLFSEQVADESLIPQSERVVRNIPGGRIEVRRFSIDRARLMAHVLPALSNFTVSTSGQNGKRLVFGPQLDDGRYMLVALRLGPGEAMICVSAYPVSVSRWKDARRSKSAKFPP
jgi:hypothetical protein